MGVWQYSGANVTKLAGKVGRGLNGGRVPVPRGKMLGRSSGINYMM